jgi:inosine-uridine nucleoside N-ribohydrolase
LIVDGDPGLDDAMAIALLAAHPGIDLRLISIVAGNAALPIVTANAQAIVAALDLETPLAAGAAPARLATDLWGGDGRLPLEPSLETVVHPLTTALQMAVRGDDAVSVLAIGPLTNVAGLVRASPHRVGQIAVMGGALGRGNATPEAEFNIWADPPPAAAVLASGLPVTLAPLDLTRALHPPSGFAEQLDLSRPAAALVSRLLPVLGTTHHPATPHDLAAVGALLWPHLFEMAVGIVSVVTEEGVSEGRTLFEADPHGLHRVLTAVDAPAFWAAVAATLNGEAAAV